MKDKEYLCMKKFKGETYVVAYQLGAYYVAQLLKKEQKGSVMLIPFDRKYKTASGASRYLEQLSPRNEDDNEPEKTYGTEKFIKEGTYWKGE